MVCLTAWNAAPIHVNSKSFKHTLSLFRLIRKIYIVNLKGLKLDLREYHRTLVKSL